MYIYILLGGQKEMSEKWRTNSWFLLNDNAPAHRSVLVKDFLTKNNVTTLEHPPHSPDLAATDCYLFLVWKQQRRDGALVMLLTSLRIRRKNLQGFHKTVSTNVPPPLHSLAEVYSCRRGLFCRKYSLNDCNILHFSEIKWFRDHFETTSYVGAQISKTMWLIIALFLVITQQVRQVITDVSGPAVIHTGTYILSLNAGTNCQYSLCK